MVPIRSPMIIAKCCKLIIGCEWCVNEWYSGAIGLTKTCLLCRAERALTVTVRLNRVNSFTTAVANVLAGPQDEEQLQKE